MSSIARIARKAAFLVVFFGAFSACESGDNLGYTDQINGGPIYNLPNGGPGSNQTSTAVGSTCVNSDPNHICLALKFVVYQDSAGKAVASSADVLKDLGLINQVWSQCNIGFQVEEYDPVDPTQFGLVFNTANTSDLDRIRNVFDEDARFLLVTTGAWNRNGTLGQTGANAWTAMPGGGPYGSIFEAPVATYGPIFAHELGHYLNLEHVADSTDVMNPVIYTTSTKLTAGQCGIARATASGFWSAVTRTL